MLLPLSVMTRCVAQLNLDRLVDKVWDYLGLTRCVACAAAPIASATLYRGSPRETCYRVESAARTPTRVRHPRPIPHRSIYTKKRGQPPDLKEPVVLTYGRHGITVDSLCSQVRQAWRGGAGGYVESAGLRR